MQLLLVVTGWGSSVCCCDIHDLGRFVGSKIPRSQPWKEGCYTEMCTINRGMGAHSHELMSDEVLDAVALAQPPSPREQPLGLGCGAGPCAWRQLGPCTRHTGDIWSHCCWGVAVVPVKPWTQVRLPTNRPTAAEWEGHRITMVVLFLRPFAELLLQAV